MLEQHPWLSLLPPLAAVALAFWLHRVIPALFLGILSAFAILLADRWWAVPGAALDRIVATAAVSDNLRLIVFSVLIGGLVALLKDARAFESFARIIERTRRGLRLRTVYGLTLVLGCTLFLETWSNVLISGTTLRGLYDRLGVSRERMAYFLHTVSISVVALVPINSWAAFYMGLLRAQGIEQPFQFLLGSVPFMLYCWTNLLLVGIVMSSGWTFGPIARFERAAGRVLGTTDVAANVTDGTVNSRWGAAVLAITLGTLIGTVLLGLTVTGNGDPRDGNGAIAVLYAVVAAIAVAALALKLRGVMRFSQIEARVLAGCGEFIGVAVMVVLALTLGALIKELGTGAYVAGLFQSTLPRPWFAPLIFLVGAGMSFATGTSYGTFAIMTPIAIPLALQSGADPHLLFGACIAGGVFGDNTSPISDTSIVTAVATEAKLLDHVTTQLPYALVSASASALGFLALGLVLG